MQPTLVLSAPLAGILYINGRFAGELSKDAPLLRPVSSHGAVYLDYRPLSGGCASMARKLVFSGGAPMQQSVDEAENLNIILWPGGTVEIELHPETLGLRPLHFELSGHHFLLDGNTFSCDGHRLSSVPEGIQPPELFVLPTGNALLGKIRNDRYLMTLDAQFTRQTGFLRARQIELETDGHIRAVVSRDDLVGHATLENWKLAPEGLTLLSREPAWLNGQPIWPAEPAKAARAMVEASLAELDGEAEAYLSPALRAQNIPARLRESCDLCIEMRYAPPDARPCVGLLRLSSDRLAQVHPLYYRAVPTGGPQGPWQIEAIQWE